jgi:tetratricopeptide (TPR) repeat protein
MDLDELPAAERELLAADPERLSAWHWHAAQQYAAQLAQANAAQHDALEARFMYHAEARFEALIRHQPTTLADEATAAPLALLRQGRNRQLMLYYRALGQGLRDAFEPARVALADLLAQAGLDSTVRARALNSDAIFAWMLGDYQQACDSFTACHALWRELGNGLRQGLASNNLGGLLSELQRYDEAERHYQEAVALFAAADDAYLLAQAYNELGLLHRDRGRWGEARATFELATTQCERAAADDILGRVLNNTGEVELLQGNYRLAAEYFARALHHMTQRVYEVDVWLNQGLIAQAEGEHAAALDHYTTALTLAEQIARRDVLPLLHYRSGHAAEQLGHDELAGQHYAQAVAAVEARREPLRDEGLLISLMGRWQLIYEAALLHCLARGDLAGAFGYAEQARARAFADLLARRRLELQQSIAPLGAAPTQAALPAGTLLLSYFACGLRGPEAALLDAMPPAAAGLRACLTPPARLVAFLVGQGTLRAELCPLDPNLLQSNSPFLADGRRFLQPALLRRLYDALIAPLAEALAQAERVVVVPHGPLHQLPFAALPSQAGEALLERVPCLSYAPSATLLLHATHTGPSRAQRSCLAIGYDGGDGTLRHTVAEAAAVAERCNGEWRRGTHGICAELRANARHYRRLHLACHGELDLDDPLASLLELGPDERLRAVDVLSSLQLDADLVVLSACRSGVSQILRGDEPLGLVRAFLSAGARAVLVTLWPVEDASARALMEHFYAALDTAQPDPAQALKLAQQHLRADPRYADPFYWAAYTLIGA